MSTWGQAIGAIVGGIIGTIVPALGTGYGAALGMLIGGIIDPSEYTMDAPEIESLQYQSATFGGAVPALYGENVVKGNCIFLGGFRVDESSSSSKTGKGAVIHTTRHYYHQTIAFSLCYPAEGYTVELVRILMDGHDYTGDTRAFNPFTGTTSVVNYNFYDGTQEVADPTLESLSPSGRMPAYKGLCYIVFPDFGMGQLTSTPDFTFVLRVTGPKLGEIVEPPEYITEKVIPFTWAETTYTQNTEFTGAYKVSIVDVYRDKYILNFTATSYSKMFIARKISSAIRVLWLVDGRYFEVRADHIGITDITRPVTGTAWTEYWTEVFDAKPYVNWHNTPYEIDPVYLVGYNYFACDYIVTQWTNDLPYYVGNRGYVVEGYWWTDIYEDWYYNGQGYAPEWDYYTEGSGQLGMSFDRMPINIYHVSSKDVIAYAPNGIAIIQTDLMYPDSPHHEFYLIIGYDWYNHKVIWIKDWMAYYPLRSWGGCSTYMSVSLHTFCPKGVYLPDNSVNIYTYSCFRMWPCPCTSLQGIDSINIYTGEVKKRDHFPANYTATTSDNYYYIWDGKRYIYYPKERWSGETVYYDTGLYYKVDLVGSDLTIEVNDYELNPNMVAYDDQRYSSVMRNGEVCWFVLEPRGTRPYYPYDSVDSWNDKSEAHIVELTNYTVKEKINPLGWSPQTSTHSYFENRLTPLNNQAFMARDHDPWSFGLSFIWYLSSGDDMGGLTMITPPQIAWSILTDKKIGLGLDEVFLNKQSFIDSESFCWDNGFFVSMHFFKGQSILDILKSIVNQHNGYMTMFGGQIYYHQLKEEDAILDLDELNTELVNDLRFLIQKEASHDTVDRLTLQYVNGFDPVKQATVVEANYSDIDINATKQLSVKLLGIDRHSMASKMANYLLYKNNLQTRHLSVSVHLDVFKYLRIGDVYTVTNDKMGLDAVKFRVTSVQVKDIGELSITITLAEEGSYFYIASGTDNYKPTRLPDFYGPPSPLSYLGMGHFDNRYNVTENSSVIFAPYLNTSFYDGTTDFATVGAALLMSPTEEGDFTYIGNVAGALNKASVVDYGQEVINGSMIPYIDVEFEQYKDLTSTSTFESVLSNVSENVCAVFLTESVLLYLKYVETSYLGDNTWRLYDIFYNVTHSFGLYMYIRQQAYDNLGDIHMKKFVVLDNALPVIPVEPYMVGTQQYYEVATYNRLLVYQNPEDFKTGSFYLPSRHPLLAGYDFIIDGVSWVSNSYRIGYSYSAHTFGRISWSFVTSDLDTLSVHNRSDAVVPYMFSHYKVQVHIGEYNPSYKEVVPYIEATYTTTDMFLENVTVTFDVWTRITFLITYVTTDGRESDPIASGAYFDYLA